MNQISIGDTSGWTVLDGASIAAPYRRAAPFFNFGPGDFVKEKIEISLNGTPAQILTALGTLEKIRLRAMAYDRGEYTYPQYLRFQTAPATLPYYTPITEIHLVENPTGYRDRQRGSLLVELHYTRPNWFDGEQAEVALTGRAGTDVTGGIQIVNHTDAGALDGNTVLIKAADASTDLPAPLRIEIQNNTALTSWYRALVGSYHHPTYTGEDIFFGYSLDFVGGINTANPLAISGNFRTLTFTSSTFVDAFTYPIPSGEIASLDGRTYRPVLNFFVPFAYTDLHMRLELRYSTFTLHYSEAVYCDPNFQYVIFPPIQLPPNQLLRETTPQWIEIDVQGLREGGALAQVFVDWLMLLPVESSLIFNQFIPLTGVTDKLVYDAHRELSNVRYSGTNECVSHIRQGGPLLLYPRENTRLFFTFYNTGNVLGKDDTAIVRAYYRPRISVL